MQRFLMPLGLLFVCQWLNAQYVNDNVLYKTVYPKDLCKTLEKNPGYLLLDVRSPGEYSDTSSSTALNIGHLNGARNIDIRQVGSRISEIAAYRDKPVFVYCSHSQRSRRVSKMLADSGFTQVNNINGGLTGIYLLDDQQRACLQSMITSANPYTVLSPRDVCNKLSKSGTVFLLDVRPDSAWNHQTSNARVNAVGSLKGTHHIAVSDLRSKFSEIPRDKEIIITDVFGGDAAVAAKLLRENGFDKVYTMLEGLDRWLGNDKTNWNCAKGLYQPAAQFAIVGSEEFSHLPQKDFFFLDVRTAEEFNNKSTLGFRNTGHFRNAVNIPLADLPGRISELEAYKSKPVVVYAFAGGPEAFSAADILSKNGFRDLRVLAGGLFNLRWTAANIPGMSQMSDWVVDVPSENK
jgi:rhodanese-related sulfurtransferase